MYLAEPCTLETGKESHSSSEFSNYGAESVHHTDKEIQADMDRSSNMEGSYQEGSADLKEIQAGIEFAVQISPIKESKKHKENTDAVIETPGSSFNHDDIMETLDNKNQAVRLAVSATRGTSTLQPEAFSRIDEASSLEGMGQLSIRHITAADLDLEKMRLEGAMTRLKYRQEDNEKQRQHEERMAQLRLQARSRSIGEELRELFQPQNQYALFFFCFIFIHVIYTAKELAFYFITKHHLFCFVLLLYFLCKKILFNCKGQKN
ncbi:uncharacterized protein LOC100566926 isoform X1 [Anolis carolinensis]|uniref:uncharacterized protein LOC100566926 isoform X1 n=1 Tax=Anolis carolinensis TaxID=28377 RepID=UPI000462C5B7|nr:PREDICTED: uncharacterized protein LOC100566926 [Anolis carolinensis]|eukprot:XP_003217518.2 PREDICTED: uncharacterized protein LOC100566926 [Anolis carolinensis]